MRVFGITGWKNSGKTTLMERLVTEICSKGFTVSTLKHAHHNVDVDQPGKDSHRHRVAGAHEVILASANRWALMHELRNAEEPPLEFLLSKLAPVDLVLVEGYKQHGIAKIEASVRLGDRPLLAFDNHSIKAVAAGYHPEGLSVPVLDINDIPCIADFILAQTGLAKCQTGLAKCQTGLAK
ncbi:MAG: molybdopterin-guanine dinucleotide biosynthesis protein B [Rhodobacteraceae bacterium]|nr:molybdopterin-guanine dinucleotide biosynthesis protein B [Paracoccaceae bacterium]